MLQATSPNSNDRIPEARWGRIWLAALILTCAVIVAWEGFWRAKGYRGQPKDEVGLWAVARAQASRNSDQVVVFVGSSRTQLAINLGAFREVSERVPVQLSIAGHSAFPVLRHLSEDTSFRGLVVCEVMERSLPALQQQTPEKVPAEWIGEVDGSNVFTEFEWRLQILSQRGFAFRLPGLAPRTLASHLSLWTLPPRPYLFVSYPRGMQADYALTDVAWHRNYLAERAAGEYALDPAPPPDKFLEGAETLRKVAQKLRSRGGEVVLMRPPTSGRIWEIEEASYPRAVYWDAFAARVNAPTLHFKDYPSLSAYECADGIHLDYRDAIPFTKALVKVLSDRGLLAR